MIVAIHQPNFFPWLGFFDKIARADVFVLLDDVQFPKTGGTWTNRVKLMIGGAPEWFTVPIRRDYHGVKATRDIAIDDSKPWRDRMRKTLEANYGRAPHFAETLPLVASVFAYDGGNLVDFNERGLRLTLDHLGWPSRAFVRSSTLGLAGQGTDRLIGITKSVEGDTYLCGGGAGGYQDDAAFAAHGVTLRHQQFQHPEYPQSNRGSFQPGLSVLDALFEIGARRTAALLHQTR